MKSPIPFIKTADDAQLSAKYFSWCQTGRLSLRSAKRIASNGPLPPEIWIDTEIEGLHFTESQRDPKWQEFMSEIPGFSQLSRKNAIENPTGISTDDFVSNLLDRASAFKPKKITVPQIPYNKEFNVSRINRKLAKSASKWRQTHGRKIEFVTPLVLTHQSLSNTKSERNKIVSTAKAIYEISDSQGLWFVDSSLVDQNGTANFRDTRFKGLIEFADELNTAVHTRFAVCGPHWGLNLVMWARGLITTPAISMGNAYCYYISGAKRGKSHGQPNIRIALPPLNRWAVASQELKIWLQDALTKTEVGSREYNQFKSVSDNLEFFQLSNLSAREQVCEFYRELLKSIEDVPEEGRSLALYQSFSSSFIIGRSLSPLPKSEKSARRPEKIAEQFMTNCL